MEQRTSIISGLTSLGRSVGVNDWSFPPGHPWQGAMVEASMKFSFGGYTRRRDFITLFGGTAATRSLAARAQQPAKMKRIAFVQAKQAGILLKVALLDSAFTRQPTAASSHRWNRIARMRSCIRRSRAHNKSCEDVELAAKGRIRCRRPSL